MVAPTRVYCLFHTSWSCNSIPLYNSHDRRVYIPSLCIVCLQDGRVNRLFWNAHDGRVYIIGQIWNAKPGKYLTESNHGKPNLLYRILCYSSTISMPTGFSSGGTCTLLPSFLGVHPNFWGCNVPSNSSFGGTKKINCVYSMQGRAPCCFL